LNVRSLVFVSGLAACVASLAAPAAAQAPPSDHRYEVTLVFGASLLSADGDSAQALPFDSLQTFEALLPAGTLRRLLPSAIETHEHDHMGASFLQGFQISRRLARRGWIEGEFLIAPAHTRKQSTSFRCPAEICALAGLSSLEDALGSEQRVTAYHYGLGFAYELARGEVRPFVSVGAGAVTYDVPRGGGTSFAFEFGAGARLSFSERIGGRIEVVDRVIPDHFLSGTTEHDVQVRAGAVFRLP
jgi:hypothetical protein